MIDEKKFQDQINRRLSGLNDSELRRTRIRDAVSQERKEFKPMKRTVSKSLALAAAAVLLIAAAAIAERFNLFSLFGARDGRYGVVAPYAALDLSEPVLAEHPELGSASASIDSAYFDGLSLNLAYRISHGRNVAEYAPSEWELALMRKGSADALITDFFSNEPGSEILRAWNQALESGTPYGYRKTTLYASDHTITDDGIDLYPETASPAYNESGEFCEMREFECPLPDDIRIRQELTVNIGVCQETSFFWFDGTDCYWRVERAEVGAMTAVIPRNGDSLPFSGAGTVSGVSCVVHAEVSPMVSVITFESASPLSAFLGGIPEETDELDFWAEAAAVDENGNQYRPYTFVPLDDRTGFTLSLKGTGTLPEELTFYVYAAWEGMETPDFSAMDGISIKADH